MTPPNQAARKRISYADIVRASIPRRRTSQFRQCSLCGLPCYGPACHAHMEIWRQMRAQEEGLV